MKERIDTIFKGTVQRVIRERESMESIVRIQAGDEAACRRAARAA